MKVFYSLASCITALYLLATALPAIAAPPIQPTKRHPIVESVVVKEPGGKGFTLNMDLTKTIDNFSYIPLNLIGTPSENQQYVLAALAAFEKHFSLRITWFNIENHNVWALTYGIWVTHQPKQNP
ncbi:MAG: hypothetical protein Q8R30_02535 [bacterium]|nr:hypothetical protein [bacterium]MDZ4285745.1 hypothetical protein [Candidatus Sungbacteria bacterium]